MRPSRLLLFFLLLPSLAQAQEKLTPLARNPYIETGEIPARPKSQHDSAYLAIHPLDTLDLPVKDDFSGDRFKPYSMDTSASGVKDSVFYRLFDANDQVLRDTIGSFPMDTIGWVTDTSYTVRHDTSNGDTITADSIPLPSRDILVNDLWTKEHDTVRYEVWPAFTVRDSLWMTGQDTIPNSSPDLVQDSLDVRYFPSDSAYLWTDRRVFLNHSLSEDPPSVGIATFDGLDEKGRPYNFNDPYAYGEADVLTSKPIDMSYTPLDSVYLSFFYQRKGLGNAPEPEDSLVLEYYSPGDDEWSQVWSQEGGSGTDFRQVLVPIENPSHLQKGFRFRFKNFATLSGAFDHWHLDYVRILKNRNEGDTAISDVAFTRKPQSFLETYTAVPWEHYERDTNHIRDRYSSHHSNLDETGRFVEFYSRAFYEGSQIWQQNQGVDANVQPYSRFTHDNLVGESPSDLSFPPGLADTSATFRVSMVQRTNPDTTASNDSITFEQSFQSHYAYDDGTAEVGYGISPSGANTPKIAQRFDPYVADTIIGAYIHWAPVFEDKSKESFFLTIWENEGGEPGDMMEQNISFSNPNYGDQQMQFIYYEFDDPVVMDDAQPFFLGIDQTTQTRINIGMDRNNDRSNRIYYNASGIWENTGFDGALMLRPVYATEMEITDLPPEPERALEIEAYPNPTRGKVHLRSKDEFATRDLSLTVHGPSGRRVMERSELAGPLDLSGHAPGLYLLRIRDRESGRVAVKKIMLRR